MTICHGKLLINKRKQFPWMLCVGGAGIIAAYLIGKWMNFCLIRWNIHNYRKIFWISILNWLNTNHNFHIKFPQFPSEKKTHQIKWRTFQLTAYSLPAFHLNSQFNENRYRSLTYNYISILKSPDERIHDYVDYFLIVAHQTNCFWQSIPSVNLIYKVIKQ